MTNKPLILDNGSHELDTQIETGAGAIPSAIYVSSPETENIGDLARRAYGYNTAASRDRIKSANTSLNGIVRLPLS